SNENEICNARKKDQAIQDRSDDAAHVPSLRVPSPFGIHCLRLHLTQIRTSHNPRDNTHGKPGDGENNGKADDKAKNPKNQRQRTPMRLTVTPYSASHRTCVFGILVKLFSATKTVAGIRADSLSAT